MGTSGSYGGPGGRDPLIPTWLGDGDEGPPPGDGPDDPTPDPANPQPPALPPAPPDRPLPQPPPTPGGFTAPRTNFSRFTRSGGHDRAPLRRALSGYVSSAAGGARQAAARMGSSRTAGARLISFLSDVQSRGAAEALRVLNLGALAGRPIEEIFVGLADYVCPQSGTVDEGIARDAFIETIADLAALGISDLDALTADQMQTVFEMYATHAIEARIFNDIGANGIVLPADVTAVERVEAQLRDFVQRSVSDALDAIPATSGNLPQDRILALVDRVYEAAFEILESLGESEAEE